MSNIVTEDSGVLEEIRVVELDMMDKPKYYQLTATSGMIIRSVLYPIGLVKTRLQIQTGKEVYKGMFDAMYKIPKSEGIAGLYRGFWFNSLQVIPSLFYITTYEHVRFYINEYATINDSHIRSLIAGGMASIAGQTAAVPIDIVTQHMMVLGRAKEPEQPNVRVETKLKTLQEIHIPDTVRYKRFGAPKEIIRQVYQHNGIRGFYQGYFVSLSLFAPNSAIWWMAYDFYSGKLTALLPDAVPRIPILCVCAPLAGATAACITNPMDVIRARIQVKRKPFKQTCKQLWLEEGYKMFYKGLSARLVQSAMFSFFIILGYESIKRWSLLEEYRDNVRW